MKSKVVLSIVCFLFVSLIVPTIFATSIISPAYVRAITDGPPWGQSTNEQAMDAVFGAGNWSDLRYETVNPNTLFSSSYTFVFLEGGDDTADTLEQFLDTNRTLIQQWVRAGGRLFVNAAPNVGDGMLFPFDVALVYNNDGSLESGNATAVDPNHPIFQGPFTPVGTSFTGDAFSHAIVQGTGICALINGDFGTSLAEASYGTGFVLFGGMTTTNFHNPQPEATNLRENILYHTAFDPVPGLYAADGAANNPSCKLYLLSPVDGSVLKTIGPIGFGVTGLAFHPTTHVLYGVTGGSGPLPQGSLITINPLNGAGTFVGSEVNGRPIADITFTSDGTLYGWGEGSDDLYTIDLGTGAATKVGESSTSTAGSGIAANANNVLYFGGDTTHGTLDTIDKATGLLTTIAHFSAFPVSGGRLNALAFSPSGTLYASNGGDNGLSSIAHLVTINTATAAVTDLGSAPNLLDAIAFSGCVGNACDADPPVITVPSTAIDVIAQKKKVNKQSGAFVFFNVSAFDPQDGPVTATANPPSGSFFPIGTTLVTVTATDSCGNTSTVNFPVTVAIKRKRHGPI